MVVQLEWLGMACRETMWRVYCHFWYYLALLLVKRSHYVHSLRSIKSGIREIRGMVHALIFSRFLTFYLFFQMTMSRIYPDFWTLICNFLRWMCCSDTSLSELFLSRICMVIQYLEDTNAKGAYRKLSFFIECLRTW